MSDNPFWGNLTEAEGDEYILLGKIIKPWVAWASLSKKMKVNTPEPQMPTDQEFIDHELIAMKGWEMI